MKVDNYKVGDCFEFKKSIEDFGLIFLEEKEYLDGNQYNLFPVKLDTTKNDLDKFKFGSVYITSFSDFRKPNGTIEGFMVYHFLFQKNYAALNNYFNCIGSLPINEIYRNPTGGTFANCLEDFRYQLNLWEEMFGRDGRLLPVLDILL
jgi:hypothetical protein